MPTKVTINGHSAVPCCRKCDVIMDEESDSPNPPGYFLYECRRCGNRIGLAAVAIAAETWTRGVGSNLVDAIPKSFKRGAKYATEEPPSS